MSFCFFGLNGHFSNSEHARGVRIQTGGDLITLSTHTQNYPNRDRQRTEEEEEEEEVVFTNVNRVLLCSYLETAMEKCKWVEE